MSVLGQGRQRQRPHRFGSIESMHVNTLPTQGRVLNKPCASTKGKRHASQECRQRSTGQTTMTLCLKQEGLLVKTQRLLPLLPPARRRICQTGGPMRLCQKVHCEDHHTVRACTHNEAKCITRRLPGSREPVARLFCCQTQAGRRTGASSTCCSSETKPSQFKFGPGPCTLLGLHLLSISGQQGSHRV